MFCIVAFKRYPSNVSHIIGDQNLGCWEFTQNLGCWEILDDQGGDQNWKFPI